MIFLRIIIMYFLRLKLRSTCGMMNSICPPQIAFQSSFSLAVLKVFFFFNSELKEGHSFTGSFNQLFHPSVHSISFIRLLTSCTRIIPSFYFIHPFIQAKVVLYTGAASQKELLFNAVGTDKLNWFSVDKLVSSSWTDIKSERRNYFSIQGGCSGGNCRSFFINRNYGGCGVDAGWLVTASVWCSWETNADHTKRVLYSKLSTYTNWNVKSKDSKVIHLLGFFQLV